MTHFEELVRNNRSCRGYDETCRVTREELLQMVDCARLTASTMNIQPLKYCLGTESEQVRHVLGTARFGGALAGRKLPGDNRWPTAFLLICQDMAVNDNLELFRIDVGIVAQTILLRATEMGLGGCMMSTYQEAKLREMLSLPERVVPVLLLALGKPAEEIVLVDAEEGGSTKYYRDKRGTHVVPKRKVNELVL